MSCAVCGKPCNTSVWNQIAIPSVFPLSQKPQYFNFCDFDCRRKYLASENAPKSYDYVLKGDPGYKGKKK